MSIVAYPKYESYTESGAEWIGNVPVNWMMKRAKYIWRETSETSDDGSEQLLSVSQKNGVIPRVEQSRSEDLTGYRIVHAGELVSNIMLAWMGALGVSNHEGIVSPAYSVYRLQIEADQRFLDYLYKTDAYLAEFARRSSGVVPSRWRLYTEKFGEVLTLLPPLPEQRAIAAFLNRKCTAIDEAVRIKETQIKLLRERQQILIQQAVTRGLNPDVPMKDSGIDWIGEIPAHWEVRRSKFLFRQSRELARKDDIQLSATQSYGVIPQEQFEELVGRRVVKISTNLAKRKHVELNDFVISMRSFQGGLERAYATGCIRSSYVILKPAPQVNPDFFGYLLKISRYIHALQITGNFIRDGQDLTFENFADVDLYIPPYQEQAEIAAHIKRGCGSIDNAISIKQDQIATLKEYKTSLINSAVTGKIKVI